MMIRLYLSLASVAVLFSPARSLVHPHKDLHSFSGPELVQRDACSGNTPTTRSEWCDFSIDTDYSSGKLIKASHCCTPLTCYYRSSRYWSHS